MIIKQLSIFVENRAGRLAEITEIIARHNINIRALSIADTTNFGILRIIVENPDEAEKILKSNGMTVSANSVIAVNVEDKPGGLAAILLILARENITVEYMYAFISKQDSDKAYVVLRVENDKRALELLNEGGFDSSAI